MSMKTVLAAAGSAVLSIGLLASGALADAPPAAAKKKMAEPAYTAPAKAEAYERPAAGNWGGLYIGANVGWQNADIDWKYSNPVPATCCAPFSNSRSDGALGGHVGLQHQFAGTAVVLGVEAAYSGAGAFDNGFGSKAGCIAGVAGASCQTRLDSLFTVGPRLGWSLGQYMLFINGGFASARIDTQLFTTASGAVPFDRTTGRHNGWYIGGSAEYALTANWILGLEYQHVDLGGENHLSSADAFGPSPPGANGRRIEGTDDIVRFRISYKLNRPEATAESYK